VLNFYSLAGLLGNGKLDLILNRITLGDTRCQKEQDKQESWDETCPSHYSSEYLPYSAHKYPVIKMLVSNIRYPPSLCKFLEQYAFTACEKTSARISFPHSRFVVGCLCGEISPFSASTVMSAMSSLQAPQQRCDVRITFNSNTD
jgi:hypothetical protein